LGNETAYLAYEGSCDNVTWYNPTLEIGNFWSSWNQSGAYQIEGDGNLDLYPMIDFDGDTLNETMEVLVYFTDPFNSDSDFDGLTDDEEIFTYGTDPNDEDGDDDNLSDGEEILVYGSDPQNNDTDSDGLDDGEEVLIYETSPTHNDTDSDGFSDYEEVVAGTDPLNSSSFPYLEPPNTPSYLGLILGLTGGFLAVAGATVYVLIKKGVIKLPKKITK
jgi:hypothetical protein